MKFDYGTTPSGYKSITYNINWMLDTLATPKSNVENFNDFKEARQVINKVKSKIRNAK
jgi:hypothetical protein